MLEEKSARKFYSDLVACSINDLLNDDLSNLDYNFAC